MLISLPNIQIYLRFYLIFIQVSSRIIAVFAVHFIGNQFCKYLAVFIISAQNYLGSSLSISNESFIYTSVFQYRSTILFSLYI